MASVAEESAPDWGTISEKIRCPMCEYDLRGLVEARCPECGFGFRWEEILDRTRRRHPYLFEHHAERNFKSFVATLLGGLFPWSFWKSLHPTQRPDLRRLGRYRAIIMGLTWLPFAALFLSSIPFLLSPLIRRRGTWVGESFYSMHGGMIEGRPNIATALIEPMLQARLPGFLVFMTFLLLVLPTLTAIPLAIFQATMRQAKVENHHVQRCIIYSFDVVVWPALLIFGLSISMIFVPPRIYRMEEYALSWLLLMMFPVVWALMALRLAFACRLYLRLRHALAVVLACQVIVFLMVVFLMLFVGNLVIRG
jgi:hypothetical protein